MFDFKYDGPGLGKGGTGVLSVDGKTLSRQTVEHTIPFLMSLDESLDIGLDTAAKHPRSAGSDRSEYLLSALATFLGCGPR